MKTIEKADRKVVITINGIDKTAEYRFKCNECKQINNCANMSECKHVKYLAEHAPATVQCAFLDKNSHVAAIPASDAAAFAKICTIVERTHRKRMFPYVEMNVKIK